MKKTVFVGRVNDLEFDNVNDYNACVQAMLDMGRDFQATSSYQSAVSSEISTDKPFERKGIDMCDCECNCECNNCQCDKQLKPQIDFLPAYKDRENGEYIDVVVTDDDDEFDDRLSKMDDFLSEKFSEIQKCIPRNTNEQLKVYFDAVDEMKNIIENDADKTDRALNKVITDIETLESKLDNMYNTRERLDKSYQVIGFLKNFYEELSNLNPNKTNRVKNTTSSRTESFKSAFNKIMEEIFS